MHIQQIEKIQIASEQLEDALSAYFAGRFHSALVLASAAEQLYAGYVMKHDETPAWKRSRSIVTKIANGLRREEGDKPICEDDIGDLLNKAYNSSKHAGKNDHTVFMDPKFEANVAIDRAIESTTHWKGWAFPGFLTCRSHSAFLKNPSPTRKAHDVLVG